MATAKSWIKAMRLRTLPLSLATVLTGNFLVMAGPGFSPLIFILTILTTVFLQVLSNLANDLGDHLKGTDNEYRIGPARSTQSGEISAAEMKTGIYIGIFLSLLTGILLLLFSKLTPVDFWILLGIGIGAIAAAVFYTMGKRPYGYRALGDVFVFLFFGIVGVCGSFYLHTGLFFPELLLPATSIGCFSAAVLNMNNLRDRENDQASGKNTLVVVLGQRKAKVYHICLLAAGWIAVFIFMYDILNTKSTKYIFLLALPLFALHAVRVFRATDPKDFDPELKKLAIATFFFSLLLGISILDWS